MLHKGHDLRIETPIGSRILDCVSGQAPRFGSVSGVGGVEALHDEVVEGDALGTPVMPPILEGHSIAGRSRSPAVAVARNFLPPRHQ